MLKTIPVAFVGIVLACSAPEAQGVARTHATTPLPFDVARGNVYRGAFTPDGHELYFFSRRSAGSEDYRIYVSKLTLGRWCPPERVDLGGDFSDLYPTISPDGRRMVFSSYRRAPGDTSATPNASLWYVERAGAGWGIPTPMTKATRAGQYNAGPQYESDGAVSFTAGEPLITRWDGKEFGPAEPDDRVARWQGWRQNLFVWSGTPTPYGDAMILTVSAIDSVSGRRLPADLWVSRKTATGWAEPKPLGAGVNSERNDNFPFFSSDGRDMYFVRDFARFHHVPLADALGDTSTVSGHDVVSIPFDFEDARLFVPVRAPGDTVRWYILDTGAQPTIVDADVAARLGLDVTDAGSTTGAGTNALRRGRAHGVALRVGSVAMPPMDVSVSRLDSLLSPSTGRTIPGLVGSRFFLDHVVELDFSWPVMHVHDPATYHYDGTGIVLPIRLEGGVPLIDGSITAPDGATIPMRLLVDLGAKSTLLVSEPFIRARGLAARFPAQVVSPLGAGVGGETRYAFVRVPRLALGAGRTLVTDSIIAGLSVGGTLRATWYDGLLGADYLRRYRVIFDYPHSRLILEPREPVVPPSEYDMSGMYLLAEGPGLKRFVVRELVPGGPAEVAGLRPGDVITTVDGRPAASLTLSAVRRALRSRAGREVRLGVEREGSRFSLTVTLKRLI